MTGVLIGGGHTFESLVGEWKHIAESDGPLDREGATNWLAKALNIAAQLEFSTIPPYLCALWSIKDPSAPAASTIRHVVQEEMIHMSLALNMLVSLGDRFAPAIADAGFVPKYPGQLAGGVHEGLTVQLAGLTPDALRVFLEIESPGTDPKTAVESLAKAIEEDPAEGGDATIGEFYSVIRSAFETLDPEYHIDRQLTGPLSWVPITRLSDVERAIDLIIDQGEGSAKGPSEYPYDPAKPIELSHFYRFLELYEGRRIRPLDPEGKTWGFGDAIEHPECFPMAPVPAGGWSGPGSTAPARVIELCTRFNTDYTAVLKHLDRAWSNGDQGELVHAIERMFALEAPARELMTTPIEGDPEGRHYGPDFLFLDAAD